jgi:late competence protein required for DNA uptake (superfamily II DNA/RNA helicase)
MSEKRKIPCEYCGKEVSEREANTKSYAGVEGKITLYFCRDCWLEGGYNA